MTGTVGGGPSEHGATRCDPRIARVKPSGRVEAAAPPVAGNILSRRLDHSEVVCHHIRRPLGRG